MLEAMNATIAKTVRDARKTSRVEKNLFTFLTIKRTTIMMTLTNETGGVSTTRINREVKKKVVFCKPLNTGNDGICILIFPITTDVNMMKHKIIRVLDGSRKPITSRKIHTIENIRERMAVDGSIASLSSSVYLYAQDGGEYLSGNFAQASILKRRVSIDFSIFAKGNKLKSSGISNMPETNPSTRPIWSNNLAVIVIPISKLL